MAYAAQLFTAYISTPESGEFVEVEVNGATNVYPFTDLDDLCIDLWMAGLPSHLITEVRDDVERARANGWTSDDFYDGPPVWTSAEPVSDRPCSPACQAVGFPAWITALGYIGWFVLSVAIVRRLGL